LRSLNPPIRTVPPSILRDHCAFAGVFETPNLSASSSPLFLLKRKVARNCPPPPPRAFPPRLPSPLIFQFPFLNLNFVLVVSPSILGLSLRVVFFSLICRRSFLTRTALNLFWRVSFTPHCCPRYPRIYISFFFALRSGIP